VFISTVDANAVGANATGVNMHSVNTGYTTDAAMHSYICQTQDCSYSSTHFYQQYTTFSWKYGEVFGGLVYPHDLSHDLSERTVYIPTASLCCYNQLL
jgi:hypothetical protein